MNTYQTLLQLRNQYAPDFDMTNFKTGELKYYVVYDHERMNFEVHSALGTEVLGVVYMPLDCAEKVKEYFEKEQLSEEKGLETSPPESSLFERVKSARSKYSHIKGVATTGDKL